MSFDRGIDRVDYYGSSTRTITTEEGVTIGITTMPEEPVAEDVAVRVKRWLETGHLTEQSGAMREKKDVAPYDLVPFQEITEAYTRVAEFGARKYAAWNWSLGLKRVQICSSLLRHVFAYIRGEDRDKESGLLHTDHILWNAAALSHNVHWDLEDGRRGEPVRGYKETRADRIMAATPKHGA